MNYSDFLWTKDSDPDPCLPMQYREITHLFKNFPVYAFLYPTPHPYKPWSSMDQIPTKPWSSMDQIPTKPYQSILLVIFLIPFRCKWES